MLQAAALGLDFMSQGLGTGKLKLVAGRQNFIGQVSKRVMGNRFILLGA